MLNRDAHQSLQSPLIFYRNRTLLDASFPNQVSGQSEKTVSYAILRSIAQNLRKWWISVFLLISQKRLCYCGFWTLVTTGSPLGHHWDTENQGFAALSESEVILSAQLSVFVSFVNSLFPEMTTFPWFPENRWKTWKTPKRLSYCGFWTRVLTIKHGFVINFVTNPD